jgi:phosphatidylglycerophosphatase A
MSIGTDKGRDSKASGRSTTDRAAIALATWGVGFIPFAPGTWGSAVGVGLYLLWEFLFTRVLAGPGNGGLPTPWSMGVNLSVFLAVCFSGIWAAGRTARTMDLKDPQIVVGDEVMGQLTTFLFIPFGSSWKVLLAGFILFRIFDIWKPYPIRKTESLPGGMGICADDLLAGVFAGVVLFPLATFIL